jgi:hypothetical protein
VRRLYGVTTQVAELSYLHSRDVTYAVFCQGPYDESVRYRDFMSWDMPWYSARVSLDALLVGRHIGLFHLVCHLRDGDRVFETYWTTRRGVISARQSSQGPVKPNAHKNSAFAAGHEVEDPGFGRTGQARRRRR